MNQNTRGVLRGGAAGRGQYGGAVGPGMRGRLVVVEDIETEAEKQLRQLAKKQLNNQVSLEEHLENKKSFTPSATYAPASAQLRGTHSLQQFKSIQEEDERTQSLLQSGLTQQEVKVKLQEAKVTEKIHKQLESDVEPLCKKSKLSEASGAHTARMDAINMKILQRQKDLEKPTTFGAVKALSRHEMELERAITRDRGQADLLGCLVTEEKAGSSVLEHKYPHPNHPMNKIQGILHSIVGEEEEDEEGVQTGEFIGPMEKPEGHVSKPLECESMIGPWVPVESTKRKTPPIKGCESCKQQQSKPDKQTRGTPFCVRQKKTMLLTQNESNSLERKDRETTESIKILSDRNEGGVRLLEEPVEAVPKENILQDRLSVEQIKEISRFKDYAPGAPSKTLYIKNLSAQVQEADLASLFLHFQPQDGSTVVFRLLTGRMRGQAFVTFEDEQTATAALYLVNGYNLKGKPVVIQYSKPSSQTPSTPQPTTA